ncbi:MAG: 16S rRNA processing protein RimM [Clostridia bacterium]|nr:16S rRNA processing protein RimM [Clostridia bacterium]
MEKELLEAGKIINTHALKGEVRIYPYCDSADFLCDVKKLYIDGQSYKVNAARVHKGQALIKFKGVNSIEEAEALLGKLVYFDKADVKLDEGQYFIDDIIGLTVKDVDTDVVYGKVTDVFTTGANDVFEVTGDRVLLVPKIDPVVINIDLKNKLILIRPLEGLFE